MTFKPMLAATVEDTKQIKYPVYASIKYDGIRAMMQNGQLVSRTLKPIPNKNVQEMFKDLPENIDGELMFGDPAAKDVFQLTTSVVMSHSKPASGIKFYAFDLFSDKPFESRNTALCAVTMSSGPRSRIVTINGVEVVGQRWIQDEKQLLEFEQEVLNEGYEGLILRSENGLYKQGRATLKQGWLLKLKRFIDAEAKVTGFYEEMENTNEAVTNALGRTERSSHKAGMVGKGTLGGFEVIGLNGIFKDTEFSIGSGLTAEQKKTFWSKRKTLIDKIVKYKYFPIGVKDKPRLPIFLGFRDKADM